MASKEEESLPKFFEVKVSEILDEDGAYCFVSAKVSGLCEPAERFTDLSETCILDGKKKFEVPKTKETEDRRDLRCGDYGDSDGEGVNADLSKEWTVQSTRQITEYSSSKCRDDEPRMI